MAASPSIKYRDTLGGLSVRFVDITLDNSYPTGGWALTPAQLGLGTSGQIRFVDVAGRDGYLFDWDYTNGKLRAFQGDNTNAAAAPAIEVTNLSAALNNKVVRLMVVGVGTG